MASRSEAEAIHLYGMKLRPLGRGVFINYFVGRSVFYYSEDVCGETYIPHENIMISRN
jgi:hypothetical protein